MMILKAFEQFLINGRGSSAANKIGSEIILVLGKENLGKSELKKCLKWNFLVELAFY